jgi:hypothetical protein
MEQLVMFLPLEKVIKVSILEEMELGLLQLILGEVYMLVVHQK